MIKNILDNGFMVTSKTDTGHAVIGYKVTIIFDEKGKERRKIFSGTDTDSVIKESFNFILQHYKLSNK